MSACNIETSDPRAGAASARLEALVTAHHAFVWRSLRRLGVPDGDIDDASQQVFLVAHRRLAKIASESERAFLFQTALRVAADWRRARRRRGERAGVDLLEVPDLGANPEELMDQRRARAVLDRVLAVMPMELRAVFVLFELEEMSTAQIAQILEIPVGTAASRLRRAREEFRQIIKRRKAQEAHFRRPSSGNGGGQ